MTTPASDSPRQSKPLVRVTQLEKFRRFMSGNYEYETEQNVIDSITQEFQGNEYTDIGTAFHSIVETGAPVCEKVSEGMRTFLYYGKPKEEPVPCGRKFVINGNDVCLDIAQIKTALAYRSEHPGAYHEVRTYKDYGNAVVTGCADMIDGIEIRDIKTKYSTPNDIDYIDSCQARFYMELFDVDVFHYDLFVFDGYKTEKHGRDVRGVPLTRHTPAITVYRYPKMHEDNMDLLSLFLDWAERKKLMDFLIKQEI